MDWGGFPLGFRFKVKDYNQSTKAVCWQEVLRVLSTACWDDVTLYDVEISEPFPPYDKLYIAVVDHLIVPTSRLNAPPFREDARLMGMCNLYQPIIQENYLELYTGATLLAKLEKDGSFTFPRERPAFFPAALEREAPVSKEGRCLVWARTQKELQERCFELSEKEPHKGIRRVLLTDKGDTVPAIVSCREGLLFSIGVHDETTRCGILPGNVLLVNLSDCAKGAEGIEALLSVARSQGFTKAVLLTEETGYSGTVPEGMELSVDPPLKELYRMDIRLRECTDVYKKESLPTWAI